MMSTRRRLAPTLAATAALVGAALGTTAAHATTVPLPNSIAAIGDSISQAYDVCCSYADHPADSWTTGYSTTDGVNSHYKRILTANSGISGHYYDDAVTGAKVGGTGTQASSAVSQAAQYVTILIGANDVCTSSIATMTPTATFQSQFQSTMSTLESGLPAGAHIFVSSIPNIYNLWQVLHTNSSAQFVWSAAKICQSMLSSSNTEAQRQQVLSQEQADNTVLQQVCQQYANCLWDNLATYNTSFLASQVSTLDYFHPNLSGQAALATTTWGASWWPTTP
jgi:lysophospholipase L1-like esterase